VHLSRQVKAFALDIVTKFHVAEKFELFLKLLQDYPHDVAYCKSDSFASDILIGVFKDRCSNNKFYLKKRSNY